MDREKYRLYQEAVRNMKPWTNVVRPTPEQLINSELLSAKVMYFSRDDPESFGDNSVDTLQVNIMVEKEDRARFREARDKLGVSSGKLFSEMLAAWEDRHAPHDPDEGRSTIHISIQL